MAEPFEDSRRLTGCNVYFRGTGAALESAAGVAFDDATIARWCDNIADARAALAWPNGPIHAQRHASGATLAFAAPFDRLYTATEVAEWAWYDALGSRPDPAEPSADEIDHDAPPHAATLPRSQALQALAERADAEGRPLLVALHREAAARALPFLTDDDVVTLGAGNGARTWALADTPEVDAVDWSALHAIPVALVTGSNGKTTSVRLIAAMLREHGLHVAHSCTDGVFFDGALLEGGDFSGPGGARTALRQPQADAAVLETARGGMLRRGLALCRADAAVVTNIAADHFGEYGVHDLDDLARTKLTIARAVEEHGLLVLNADDAVLRPHAPEGARIGWFARAFDDAFLAAHRAQGGATCGVRDARLLLAQGEDCDDLGAIAEMPLTLDARAAYNIANISAAALAAWALGVPAASIATTLARFGADHADNPGRLQRWRFGELQVVLDYAHNPDGLRGLLEAIGARQRKGRLAIVLGHAGNRVDDDLRAVAATAAAYDPQLVVLKDIAGYERGRASGEIADIMHASLREHGVPEAAIETRLAEVEAARRPLQWARDGDLVVLPVHETAAREAMVALLDRLRDTDWRAGQRLPDA